MATNEQIIWQYLKARGFTDAGVAGTMGNLYAESGLNPKNLQNSKEKTLGLSDEEYTKAVDNGTYTNFVKDKAGYGLAQWTYWSLKQDLYDYAKSKNQSIGDLNLQLEFLVYELQKDFKKVYKTLTTTNSIKEASNTFLMQFERPANQSETVQNKRISYAQTYYDKYTAKQEAQNPEIQQPTNTGNNLSAVQAFINTAINEIGYLEKASNNNLYDKTANAGKNNYTKYAKDLDDIGFYNGKKNGYAWCDVFVDWCFVKTFGAEKTLEITGQPKKSAGAACAYSADYYKKKGWFHTNTPSPGDQIFFITSAGKIGHTGLVEKVQDNKVYTIEGNTSSKAGVVENGGAVERKSYKLNSSGIYGYGTPHWEFVKDMFKNEEEEEEMTQEKFNEMMNTWIISQANKSADSWSTEPRQWAEETGLITGDGQGRMMYKKFITREEFITVLHRFFQKLVN